MKAVIRYSLTGVALAALLFAACREAYIPPTVPNANSNLVVDGFINISADSTIINLSRTVKLSDTVSIKPELKAVVTVENNAGASYVLTENPKGKYVGLNHPLPATPLYRLRIKTTDGKTYLSDYVPAKVSPPIDSISWKAADDRLSIYANTHDPQNKTIYYKYAYLDTWEFDALYQSFLKTVGNTVVDRPPAEQIYTCWAGTTSTLIDLASSAKLGQDVISGALINTIPYTSEKIGKRYSILVKQYPLTKEGFDFWTNLKKNTETLGSIFDAQPTVLSGNIHNAANADEIVIGFISAGTFTTDRIYINKSQLPANYYIKRDYECEEVDLKFMGPGGSRPVEEYIYTKIYIPLRKDGIPPNGYISALPICADCTLRGVNKKPSFW